MSFESGRKLGLTASLIYVITPIVELVVFVTLLIFALANSFSSSAVPSLFGIPTVFSVAMIAFAVVAFLGFVLFIIAMYRLSGYYHSPGIFKNILIAIILNIVGVIVAFILVILFLISTLPAISPNPIAENSYYSASSIFILGFIGIFALVFVVDVVSSVLYMRAFHELAEKSGENNFRTAGTLYLVGAVLAIVLVGGLIVWIAWIFAAMGFRNLKPQQPSSNAYYPQFPPPGIVQTKRCPNCGAENNQSNLYCSSCGSALM
jgi:uncharacterized membrane protein